jgi:2-isopropylmalate synthase
LTSITGVQVQPNKAIVGANAFAHEAGIHQDGVLKHPGTYEIMKAADIGLIDNKLIMGKHSGRHAFANKLKELGFVDIDDQLMNELFLKFKELADKKKDVTERDIMALASEEFKQVENKYYTIEGLKLETGTDIEPTAEISVNYLDKEKITKKSSGNGPVDAIFKTIDALVDKQSLNLELLDYIVHAVTEGTDALGEVTVRIKRDNHIFTGYGADTDVMYASAEAYLNAINKLLDFDSKRD